jgi:hypothetical protein
MGQQPPPPGAAPAAMTPQYQAYMQQYYQYYQYMYSNPAMMQAYMASNPSAASGAIAAAAAANMQNYYNFPAGVSSPVASPSNLGKQQQQQQQQKKTPPAANIKFNLKYQQEQSSQPPQTAQVEAKPATPAAPVAQTPPIVKKSRFDLTSNVASEQKAFSSAKTNDAIKVTIVSTPLTNKPPEAHATSSSSSAGSIASEDTVAPSADTQKQTDIVYDIKKWPDSLKAYCAKVYAHYQQLATLGDDQVTKYLQKRITEVFKQSPDLLIDWENEPLPDVASIKKVSPFSQQQLQLQQQKMKQQQQLAQQKAAQAAAALASQKKAAQLKAPTLGQLAKQQSKAESKKKQMAGQRKRRSSSSSSSSSSRSRSSSSSSSGKGKKSKSDGFNGNYIPLSSSNNKRKFNSDDEDDNVQILNTKNMSNKQRKKLLFMQKKALKQKNAQQAAKNANNYDSFLKKSNEPVGRRTIRSISELERVNYFTINKIRMSNN